MHKTRMAIVATILTLLGTVGVGVGAASAGECALGIVCGVIKNSSASSRSILITCAWPNFASPYIHLLYPGETSTKWCKDADGYYIPSGATQLIQTASYPVYLRGPQWRKISDGPFTYTVRIL